MDDFVGPSRFQWTDRNIKYASLFRATLPRELLTNPHDPKKFLSTNITKPSIEEMIKADPTEAAESGKIIPCIRQLLPGAKIIPTGGSIYHTGMNDVIGNINLNTHIHIIEFGLLLDRLLLEFDEFQYAVCVHSL